MEALWATGGLSNLKDLWDIAQSVKGTIEHVR